MATGELEVRRATGADRDAVIEVATRALGWAGDERDRAFFGWKHDANPFGPSPAWVATLDGAVVGFRTFLRWELRRGDTVLRMVRAVDTATDPRAQGKGIFRRLTLAAVDELTDHGFDAVFNTPNAQSRPGYLKMGWVVLGRPTLGVVPRGPSSLLRLVRSKAPASKWSEPVEVGERAIDALGGLAQPPSSTPDGDVFATGRSLDFLRWRYGFEPLHYRAIEVRGGLCIFRVRRRGPSREVAICDWLSTERDPAAVRRLVREVEGDYAVGVGLGPRTHGAVPIPRQGPIVTWRALARPDPPALRDVAFALGDLELL